MRKTFRIFNLDEHFALCDFINALAKQKRKFLVTPHLADKDTNGGFVVWYYK